MEEQKDLLKEYKLRIKKLERENRRLQTESEILKNMNEQVSRTQRFFHEENQRQICYNNQLLKTSPYILVMVNEKLETVMASDVFFQVTEVSRDAVKEGMKLSEAFSGFLMEDELKSFLERCEKVLESHGTDTYLLTTGADDKECFYQVDICYYLAQNEDAKGLSIIFSDMTEIVEAKEKAENADKAKSNFLANMSHEIRTPMNAISGMAEFILRDSTDEEARKNAAMIKSATKSLIAIINDILDFSKIESGKMEIINETYSLSSLINDVTTMIRIRLEDKKVSLKTDVDPKLPDKLYGDEGRIKQILINLLNNAVKFTAQGEITFTMGFSKMSEDRIRLQISVADTGIGIKEEELGKIFDSFTQADTKRNRSIEGTGLGLAISRKLVSMMGGELRVSSEYGKGSVFSFDIVNEVKDWGAIGNLSESIKNIRLDAYETMIYAPKAKILVVDDNKLNLKVAQGILKPYGIVPDCVESGAEALIAVQKCEYDLIFMDHMMPVMDGVETMQKLRKKEGGEDMRIVALTANALSGVETRYTEAGFDGFLAKPIEPKEMEALLQKMLPEEYILQAKAGAESGDHLEKKQDDPEIMEFPSPGDDPEIMEFPLSDDEDILEFSSDGGDDASPGEDVILDRLCGLGLNVTEGLNYFMNQKAFYLEMVRDYVTEWSNKEKELESSFAAEDWNSYKIVIHAMKSASKMIGADELSAGARELELAAIDGKSSYIVENHRQYMDSCEKLIGELDGKLRHQ